jgi:LysM repeat protein
MHMKSRKAFAATAFILLGLGAQTNVAQARVEAGMLTCEVGEGFALIISKPRDLHCVFHKSNGQNDSYRGTLSEVGLDVGVSGRGVIAWAVLAETTELPPGELAGSYGGVEAGAAAVVGGRGEVLVGGARRTISLQPLSVEGEVGVNIAVGISAMELHPLMTGRPFSTTVRIPAVGHSHASVPKQQQETHYGCGSYTHLQRGQTLSGLARTCGVTLESLLDANPQITNVRKISDGALIHLPSHVGHHTASPCGDRAILQPDESLDHLAWRCGVTLHALLRQNPGVRDLSLLEPGLVLLVPARSEPVRQAPVQWARTEADLITVGWKPDRDQPTDQAGAQAKRACLDKVSRETGEPNVTVLSSEFSQANSVVMVGVGANRAPWRCLVSNGGVVAEFSFAGDDGDGPGEGTAVQLPDRIPVADASNDAKVPGTNFNATGPMPCARNAGQPMTQCKFGVIREGNGNGSITVFWPDGGNRVIYFEDDTPMSYDESQADGGAKMTVSRSDNGIYTVKIGSQRFEIVDSIMTGG